ncbi:MAG: ATP-binding cassette domain-containing protein [Spirochaetales bacterium]|nr:ATP-binding cassette domain-containing protein [Spirochaetales bacterium]
MIHRWLGLLLVLLLWYGISLIAGSYSIPFPHETLIDSIALLSDPFNWVQILLTLFRTLAGFTFALAAGLILGLMMGLKKKNEDYLRPFVLFFQGIPPLLWVIPLILILGIGHFAPVLVIALVCFPLISVNITEGVKSLPANLDQMLKVFAGGFTPRLRELILPHLKPFLASSVKLGIVLGLKTSVVGEYFGANDGIGFRIQAAFQTLRVRNLFSWGMILILLILLFDYILSQWQKSRQGTGRGKSRSLHKSRERKNGNGYPGSAEPVDNLEYNRDSDRIPLVMESLFFSYVTEGGHIPDEKMLFENLNFKVKWGEIAVISGDSGCGKTTLLKLAASLLFPARGTVTAPEPYSFLFQESRLLPWRSIRYNTALPLLYSGCDKRLAFGIADFLLKEAGLGDLTLERTDELSGGMKRRVELARCFARHPGLIILDEPFTGLQKDARAFLWERFLSLWNEIRCPVLVATHYPEEFPPMENISRYALRGNPVSVVRL